MPSIKKHKAISMARTKRTFDELHRWIDELQKELGPEHRCERHYWSSETRDKIKEFWDKKKKGLGDTAVEEWLYHIIVDNIVTLYKYSKQVRPMQSNPNLFVFGVGENGYVYRFEKDLSNEDLIEIFKRNR